MNRRFAVIAATAAAALALLAAGCGGSGAAGVYGSPNAHSSAQTTAPNAAAPSAAATGQAAKIGVGQTGLGKIIVDSRGRTLYLFEKDPNGKSACEGQCAAYWPPLITKGNAVALSGVDQSLLGWTKRADGSWQVTYAGHPLYLYVGDQKPGDTTGEGLTTFGAGWDALSPAGAKVESE